MSSVVALVRYLALTLFIPFWNFPFLNASWHYITNNESGVSTPFFTIFIRIRRYTKILYLGKFLVLFVAKFNNLILNRIYSSDFCILMLLEIPSFWWSLFCNLTWLYFHHCFRFKGIRPVVFLGKAVPKDFANFIFVGVSFQ